jgi:hydrogenase nickel incorporation protein HypA/HybF
MEKNASRRIKTIKISIGEFSGVVKEALNFAFDVLTPDTPAANADIEIEVLPMVTNCSKCGPARCQLNDLNLFCRRCGRAVTVSAGREMKVDYLDLE